MSEAAEQSPGLLERAFEERREKDTLFPRLKEYLGTQPPFLRDTELSVHFRTYYLLRHDLNDSENEVWAAGGWLRYRSGWLRDVFRIGATLYTSVPIGVGVGKVAKVGRLLFKIQLAAQYMPIRPDNLGAGVEPAAPTAAAQFRSSSRSRSSRDRGDRQGRH